MLDAGVLGKAEFQEIPLCPVQMNKVMVTPLNRIF
jgi:hypothetical protein